MKNVISKSLLLAAGLVAFALAGPANAQQPVPMRMSVPFAFVAGEHTYPAGDYWVRVDANLGVAELRSVQGASANRVLLTGARLPEKAISQEKGVIQFNVYGEAYALAGICPAGTAEGYRVKASKVEAELARTHGGAGTRTISTIQ